MSTGQEVIPVMLYCILDFIINMLLGCELFHAIDILLFFDAIIYFHHQQVCYLLQFSLYSIIIHLVSFIRMFVILILSYITLLIFSYFKPQKVG